MYQKQEDDIDPNAFSALELAEASQWTPSDAIETADEFLKAWAALARRDYNAFASFVLRDEQSGKRLEQAWMHTDWAQICSEFKEAQFIAHVEAGKLLPLDAEIATPSGWKIMGEIQVGDEVFGSDGLPCRVTAVSPVEPLPELHRFLFDDGSEVVSCIDHLWVAFHVDSPLTPQVVTTRQILDKLEVDGEPAWSIPTCAPVQYPQRELPTDPYVFGYEIADRKRIPQNYLTASEYQRRELLAGLLSAAQIDSDAYRIKYTSRNRTLIQDVCELVRSLGYRASFYITRRVSGNIYNVEWRTRSGASRKIVSTVPVDSFPGKCITVDSEDSTYLTGRDYTVTHNTWQFSVGRTLWELGRKPNSRIAIVSRSAHQAVKIVTAIKSYIENSPELRMVFPNLRRGTKNGDKWTETMITVHRDVTSKDPSVQAFGIDGGVTGARVDGFIIDDMLDDKTTVTQDARDQVERKFWRQFMSRRSTSCWVYIIGNAWHPDDLYSRLEAGGWPTFRYPVLATDEVVTRGAWACTGEDASGEPIFRKLKVGDPTWPERWPIERIERIRKNTPPIEFARAYLCVARDDADARFQRGWIETAKQRGRDNGFIRPAKSIYEALAADPIATKLNVVPPAGTQWTLEDLQHFDYDEDDDEDKTSYQARVYVGVDLSTGEARDLTTFVTILVYPDGIRRLLNVESGRWQADEIMSRLVDHYRRYKPQFMVENNGAQRYLLQLLQNADVLKALTGVTHVSLPIWPFATGRQKADPFYGIDGLAGEFAHGKWIIPSSPDGHTNTEIDMLCSEMLFYKPSAHTGDRLMGLWFARECALRLEEPYEDEEDYGGFRVIG